MERKYVLTMAQLVDRLCIVTLKSIKISEHKTMYEEEAQDIIYDLNHITASGIPDFGRFIRAVIINAIANVTIWDNETKARAGSGENDHLLRFTHSVNGVRGAAMNAMSNILEEREDLKIDCLAADVCKQNGYDFSKLFEVPDE